MSKCSIDNGLRLAVGILVAFVMLALGACSEDQPAKPKSSATGSAKPAKALDYAEARSELNEMLADIAWSEELITRRKQISLGSDTALTDTLPDIDQYPLVVTPPANSNAVVVEIFSSSEKAGTGSDGWLVEVAKAFNSRAHKTRSGKVIQVQLRKIASGTGYQFIASGKYRPDAFTPSNHLWIKMAESHGVKMTSLSERLVGNVAGIVMKTQMVDRIKADRGTTDIASLIEGVVSGDLVMGYTNPFASSTGLNFLLTVLATFGDGDEARMLSAEVVSAFEGFQKGIPYVALTTLQMRDSVTKNGALDAFVMEYQTFIKTPALRNGYEFIPFGIKHDNPLYAVGDLGPEKLEALEVFTKFATDDEFAKLAQDFGFGPSIDYQPTVVAPTGSILVQAQKLWKEKKDAGRPISAVFLVDVSGSMDGSRIAGVREALSKGSEFISPGNSIGLVVFSDQVRVLLPIKKFNLNHKATFLAGVEDMRVGGGTAMYDGVLVSLSLLAAAKQTSADIKPILFVLTDGQTNAGHKLGQVSAVVKGLGVPVYTIGYEAKLDEIKKLSSLVEAASLNAGEGEIDYKIGSMLNAQM